MSETTTSEATSSYPFQPLAFEWLSPEEALSARSQHVLQVQHPRPTRCPLP